MSTVLNFHPVHGHLRFFFFFSSRRRHTRFDCDWSSDVCSSDLGPDVPADGRLPFGTLAEGDLPPTKRCSGYAKLRSSRRRFFSVTVTPFAILKHQIGRASCRERV